MDVMGWFLAPFVMMLVEQRGSHISRWLIRLSIKALPKEARVWYEEAWLANLEFVEGNSWKLWHALGLVVRCLPALLPRMVLRHPAEPTKSSPVKSMEPAAPEIGVSSRDVAGAPMRYEPRDEGDLGFTFTLHVPGTLVRQHVSTAL